MISYCRSNYLAEDHLAVCSTIPPLVEDAVYAVPQREKNDSNAALVLRLNSGGRASTAYECGVEWCGVAWSGGFKIQPETFRK